MKGYPRIPLVPHGQLMVTACIRCKERAATWEQVRQDGSSLPLGPGGAVIIVCDECKPLTQADANVAGVPCGWRRLDFPTAEDIARVAAH